MHPAAEGRAVTFRSNQVSSWGASDGAWSEARLRLDFLAIIVGRMSEDVRQRFDSATQASTIDSAAAWVPAEEGPDGPQWAVAPMPTPEEASHGRELSDTGEFEVSLLEAELEGATFLPAPVAPADGAEGSWLYAPMQR